jgi:hypothetical protein
MAQATAFGVDRKKDIIYHDRTEFGDCVAVFISDYVRLTKSLIRLAKVYAYSND